MASELLTCKLPCELTFDINITNDLLVIHPSRSFNMDEFVHEFIGEALFWKDLDFYHSSMDLWSYIVSMNHQLVFPMDDYGYDLIRDLMKGKSITVMGRDNMSDYSDYEWNSE